MITRRAFLQKSAAGIAMPLSLSACADESREVYDTAARSIWQHTADGADTPTGMLELVRYATLAPSSHNTQCWKFQIGDGGISILPDFGRRCPAVDPDDHHLFISLGCAAENLVLAARAKGYESSVRFEPGSAERVRIALEAAKPMASDLFDAIPRRQCTRTEYDGAPLRNDELRLLEQAGKGNGVRVLLITGSAERERVLDYVVQANTKQMSDKAFVDELKDWIRFGDEEAMRTGDGLSARASGNPSVPRWLGSLLFGLIFTPKNENDKYARQLRSSAGIAVFLSDVDDKTHWIETGRCYERFALQATALGIRSAFVNQPVEVASMRQQFADMLGAGKYRPDLVVRFGRGPEMPRSLRRPLKAVIV